MDAVKLQIYSADALVNKKESPERHTHFKRFELSRDQYLSLANLCREMGVTFTASVWDYHAFDWINPCMEFYKIGSGDMTAYPILKKITSFGKPILLSTGLATFDEVRDSVNYIQSADPRYRKPEYLALLQCTSMYPIPDKEANLKVMELYREEFGLTVGYSDHTEGTTAVETAVAMGAEIIEMHFTDTRAGKTFRDHRVSFTPDEIHSLIDKIEKIKTLQGHKTKRPTQAEIDNGHVTSFRRAVYPAKYLKAASTVTEGDLSVLRPSHGIDAKEYDLLLGRQIVKDVDELEKLNPDMFRNLPG